MRSRQFLSESERSHSEVAPAPEGRNAAALGHSTLPTEGPMSSTSDKKRNNAARLAQELASSNLWSEAFMPASRTPSIFPTQHAATSSEQRVQVDSLHTAMAQPQQDVDPPPAYSNLPQAHELPATSVNTVPRTGSTVRTEREIANSACTDPEQNEDLEEQDQDVRAPLLGHIRRRWNQRGRGHWIHDGKTRRQRHCRLLAMVIAFSVIVSIIVCAFVDGSQEGGQRSDNPTGPEYELHKTFESINGAYKLYDRLHLTTMTGAIDIEIDPQPGDQPALLLLSSRTGTITLRLSPNYLHRRHRAARCINTEIRSVTGTVTAEMLLGHGSYAVVDTSTGSQILSVMASGIRRQDGVSELKTHSKTGAQNVTVTSLDSAFEPMTNLRAEHHSFATAPLSIVYPAVWLGRIHASASLRGHLGVEGDDLEYVKQGNTEIIAYRGPLQGRQTIEVISDGTGSVSFQC